MSVAVAALGGLSAVGAALPPSSLLTTDFFGRACPLAYLVQMTLGVPTPPYSLDLQVPGLPLWVTMATFLPQAVQAAGLLIVTAFVLRWLRVRDPRTLTSLGWMLCLAASAQSLAGLLSWWVADSRAGGHATYALPMPWWPMWLIVVGVAVVLAPRRPAPVPSR